jgi:hypothetical protein
MDTEKKYEIDWPLLGIILFMVVGTLTFWGWVISLVV